MYKKLTHGGSGVNRLGKIYVLAFGNAQELEIKLLSI